MSHRARIGFDRRLAAGLGALALAGVSLQAIAATAPEAQPVVRVAAGALRGAEKDGVDAFLGVPYAAPPVGALRWRAPAPAASWAGVREATRFAPSCYQPAVKGWGPYTPEFIDTPASSEDCLFLNVWRPHGAAKLPVLVWIHGGGFAGGSGAVPVYDGAHLAARGAVVVSLNYRVGPFGFLADPDLREAAKDGAYGTYGLQDMIAALKWVRENIARFGGDPSAVTIAGQSAGAASVNDLLVSPAAQGLFARAISESGPGMGAGAKAPEEGQRDARRLAEALGATTPEALRQVPADKILAAAASLDGPPGKGPPRLPFQPIRDGVIVPKDPDAAATAFVSQVPVIGGFNADEAIGPADETSPEAFEAKVRERYGDFAARLLALYPHATAEAASASARDLARDRYMAALILWAQARAGQGARVYAYRFDHAAPTADGKSWGAFHTGEVPYVFGNLDRARRPYAAADEAVSHEMQGYWLNFMRTGNPNGAGLKHWAQATPSGTSVMALGDRPGAQPAVSTPERLQAFRDYVAAGGKLSLF
jgi:para-nitrobenzyl esterase